MARPATELTMLEPLRRQMFVLLYVLGWKPFSKVTAFFNQLFEEMAQTTGFHMHVT